MPIYPRGWQSLSRWLALTDAIPPPSLPRPVSLTLLPNIKLHVYMFMSLLLTRLHGNFCQVRQRRYATKYEIQLVWQQQQNVFNSLLISLFLFLFFFIYFSAWSIWTKQSVEIKQQRETPTSESLPLVWSQAANTRSRTLSHTLHVYLLLTHTATHSYTLTHMR